MTGGRRHRAPAAAWLAPVGAAAASAVAAAAAMAAMRGIATFAAWLITAMARA